MPSGPGERPKRSCRAFRESDGRDSAAAVFTAAPRLTATDHGWWMLRRVAAQMSWPPSVPARFEEKTTSSPSFRTFGWMSFATASFSSVTGAAGPKSEPATTSADVDVAGDRRRAAREVEGRLVAGLHVRGPLLVERAVRAVGRAAEVLRLAPAVLPAVAGEVDVPQPAAARERLPAHEEEATVLDRCRTEVVRGRVDGLAEVLGRAPRGVAVRPVGDPDVEPAHTARTVRGHVEAAPVG